MRPAAAYGIVLSALFGCRINFDAIDDAGGSAITDGRGRDGTGDVAVTMISFGERTTSMRKGVTEDTYLDASVPTLNFGIDPQLSVAANPAPLEHTLLRFDLSSLAPGTTIAGARLALGHLDTGDEIVGSISVFSVAQDWVGGTGLGSVSVSNWNQRLNATTWMTAGGTRGIELAPAGVPTFPLVISLDTLVVQSWIADPASNFGLLLVPTVSTSGTHYHFHGSNHSMIDERPELVIDVVP